MAKWPEVVFSTRAQDPTRNKSLRFRRERISMDSAKVEMEESGHLLPLVCSSLLLGEVLAAAYTGHLFLLFPTRACPPPPHQTICPQEGSGDVATSHLVPFYWEP